MAKTQCRRSAIAARRAGAREGATAIGRCVAGRRARARYRRVGSRVRVVGDRGGARRRARATGRESDGCERRGGSKRAAWRDARARAPCFERRGTPPLRGGGRSRGASAAIPSSPWASSAGIAAGCWTIASERGIGQREEANPGGGDPRDSRKTNAGREEAARRWRKVCVRVDEGVRRGGRTCAESGSCGSGCRCRTARSSSASPSPLPPIMPTPWGTPVPFPHLRALFSKRGAPRASSNAVIKASYRLRAPGPRAAKSASFRRAMRASRSRVRYPTGPRRRRRVLPSRARASRRG